MFALGIWTPRPRWILKKMQLAPTRWAVDWVLDPPQAQPSP